MTKKNSACDNVNTGGHSSLMHTDERSILCIRKLGMADKFCLGTVCNFPLHSQKTPVKQNVRSIGYHTQVMALTVNLPVSYLIFRDKVGELPNLDALASIALFT